MKKAFLLLTIPFGVLTTSNFKMEPIRNIGLAARSNISLNFDFTEDERGYIYFNKVDAEFNEDSSFICSDNPYVLQHENVHFQIAYFIAKRTSNYHYFHHRYTKKKFEQFRLEIIKEWEDMDNLYDFQTEHSQNQLAQLRWNEKIKKMLQ